MQYTMTCTCGHVMKTEAADQDSAVHAFKTMMNKEAVDAHMAEKHSGQQFPSMDQVHVMIEQTTREA